MTRSVILTLSEAKGKDLNRQDRDFGAAYGVTTGS